MANSEYMFLLLSIIVYYMTKIYIFSFLSDITLPVWKQLTILALALFFNQFPYLSPLLIDPLLFLVVLRQETKQLFSLKALFWLLHLVFWWICYLDLWVQSLSPIFFCRVVFIWVILSLTCLLIC